MQIWRFLKQSFGKRLWYWLSVLFLGILIILAPSPFANGESAPTQASAKHSLVYVLKLENQTISPVTAAYIRQGIQLANKDGASVVVIELDTPGGLLNSTHDIVKDILNAPLPIVVYVSPRGARAASAGVFITLSANIAAMAPFTHIGAAHPVDMNGNWPVSPPKTGKVKPAQGSPSDVMSEKILNDTVAWMRSIAKDRGRNSDWAVKAVTQSFSLTSDEALKAHVVDLIASDLPALLQEINGRQVEIQGKSMVIQLQAPQVVVYPFSVHQKLLDILTHPLLAYLLLMLGFYGLFFEITHPGVLLPGLLGGICLILGLMGMQALSINMAGLGLILLGMILFVAEIHAPSFGAWFVSGFVCLMLGTFLLYQTGDPYVRHVIPGIVTISSLFGIATGFFLWKILKVYRRKAKGPYDKLIGEFGQVVSSIEPGHHGKVRVWGEFWDAASQELLLAGTDIRVEALDPEDTSLLKVVRRTQT